MTTADVVAVWPEAQEFGFPDEEAAFALQYGHGVGLSIWEKPIFSRLVSFDHPEVIEEGMVFALEKFWPASDGWSAARIEEQLIVTSDGCEVITRFPAEELLVAAGGHYTATGGCRARARRSRIENRGAHSTGWSRARAAKVRESMQADAERAYRRDHARPRDGPGDRQGPALAQGRG